MSWSQTIVELPSRPRGFHIITADIESALASSAQRVQVGLLHLFLQHTRLGRMMQATAQNRNVAVVIGINVERMILLTFVVNAILCAVASILISPVYLAKFTNGDLLLVAGHRKANRVGTGSVLWVNRKPLRF